MLHYLGGSKVISRGKWESQSYIEEDLKIETEIMQNCGNCHCLDMNEYSPR